MTAAYETNDLLVFSHLPWDHCSERIHHHLSRKARLRRVFYFEIPIFTKTALPHLETKETMENVSVVTPCLPEKMDSTKVTSALKDLVDELLYDEGIHDYTAWYYTSYAITFTGHLQPKAVVFDVIHSPAHQLESEEELIKKADLVITTEPEFYERRKSFHHNIHLFNEELNPLVFEGLTNLELMITCPAPQKAKAKIIPVFN